MVQAAAMALISLILFTVFVASTKGADRSISPTVISGYSHSSCPSEEVLEMARQSISTTVKKMISGTAVS